MADYVIRLLLLVPLVGALAWGSLWLWKRLQGGMALAGPKTPRAVALVGALPLGPGAKLAVVEFSGRRLLLAVSRGGVVRLADAAPETGDAG